MEIPVLWMDVVQMDARTSRPTVMMEKVALSIPVIRFRVNVRTRSFLIALWDVLRIRIAMTVRSVRLTCALWGNVNLPQTQAVYRAAD